MTALSIPIILSEYLSANTGRDYRVGFLAKLQLARKMARNRKKIKAPGLIGAGTGLGLLPFLGGFCSALGYAVKNPKTTAFEVSPQTGALP